MPCCGERRRSYSSYLGGPFAKAAKNAEQPAAGTKLVLRYVGKTALTVRGPFSGRLYRFDRPGATLSPDPRDQAALATVPALRVVKKR